ncbi:YoaK family protein [Streptomyces iconiensis]|uniref:YoaK family protein n=1 Tax=Streptomyces iconiensis TaxID=1384038 RepID=A0ABT7A721_9ACTN|nr:YoaK family protein [Streptomyces iconiensis]MDJ1137114.1 YoaK family protein [Streptomyces iconiensis]
MRTVLDRTAARLFPGDPGHHGVLPPLLVVLTFVTGIVDAVSFLALDRVFVANMTGNVVFLGFALAGSHELSAPAALLALLTFLAAAAGGGRLVGHIGHRERLFATLVLVHAVLVGASLAGAAWRVSHYALIVALACGMGLQNAVVRGLAVPDMATTVLTTTLTGMVSDRPGAPMVRRLLSVVAMFAGALFGAWLHLRHGVPLALSPAVLLLLAVAAAATVARRAAPC